MARTRHLRRLGPHGILVVLVGVVMLGLTSAASPSTAQAPRGPRPVDDPAIVGGLAWHLDDIGARQAWWGGLGQGITIAVVDSGIDLDHPELEGQISAAVSCIDTFGDPLACVAEPTGGHPDGHGTHVAGLLVARADDRVGVAGVAPRAQILAIRTLERSCEGERCAPVGDTDDVAAGVRWAVTSGAQVINLSLTAGRRVGPELEIAIQEAWDAGVIPVLAAGNRPGTFLSRPAGVVVTATDRSGVLASYAPSVNGVPFGLAAPGGADGDDGDSCRLGAQPVGIVSTFARTQGDGSGYGCLAGTSMAAPQVSGAVAILLSMGLTREQALERLVSTARPGPGLGAGRIDLAAASAGPLPPNATARELPFGGEDARPAQVSQTGPFAARARSSERMPSWLLAVLGGVSAGLAADLWLRIRNRRRAELALVEAATKIGASRPTDGGQRPGTVHDLTDRRDQP